MNNFQIFALKCLRKAYQYFMGSRDISKAECIQDPHVASQIIFETLTSDAPCLIGRFGANELLCLTTYLGVKENNRNIFSFITGKSSEWWWNEQNLVNMNIVAGFYPLQMDKIEQFCQLMLEDITHIDVLGSWLNDEQRFSDKMKSCTKVGFELLNPFFSNNPWTKALEHKKILVVHPFSETIESQYLNRKLLFDNEILVEFDLETIKAVQSYAGIQTDFKDWFEALEFMKNEINRKDFDICLIGCGAYGLPLAAYVKSIGKKAIHLGGSLQLLFGIKGKRWLDPNYNSNYNYSLLVNEYWVSPNDSETPKYSNIVEGSTYW
ncbi:MAG: hypothetical protein KA527_04705 [Cytophagaceae bacterium]|nr:hypothetical protein [Cytophagaceae bacterium]